MSNVNPHTYAPVKTGISNSKWFELAPYAINIGSISVMFITIAVGIENNHSDIAFCGVIVHSIIMLGGYCALFMRWLMHTGEGEEGEPLLKAKNLRIMNIGWFCNAIFILLNSLSLITLLSFIMSFVGIFLNSWLLFWQWINSHDIEDVPLDVNKYFS